MKEKRKLQAKRLIAAIIGAIVIGLMIHGFGWYYFEMSRIGYYAVTVAEWQHILIGLIGFEAFCFLVVAVRHGDLDALENPHMTVDEAVQHFEDMMVSFETRLANMELTVGEIKVAIDFEPKEKTEKRTEPKK